MSREVTQQSWASPELLPLILTLWDASTHCFSGRKNGTQSVFCQLSLAILVFICLTPEDIYSFFTTWSLKRAISPLLYIFILLWFRSGRDAKVEILQIKSSWGWENEFLWKQKYPSAKPSNLIYGFFTLLTPYVRHVHDKTVSWIIG